MIAVTIRGIGFAAPGLGDWPAAQDVLAGTAAYVGGRIDPPAPEGLPSAERRRASFSVRLAMAVAQQAVAQAGIDPTTLASVFASTDSDGEILHHICQALASPHPEISPTRFHNSVHNAASGYWTIAVQSRAPASMVTATDEVFGPGLLEAAVQANVEARCVLLVAYDGPMPPPLLAMHPMAAAAGLALVLAPDAGERDLARLRMEIVDGAPAAVSGMSERRLEALRLANPVGRALPLLTSVARRESRSVVLALNAENALRVHVDATR
jgi:lambda repressor-like predicted transcriptional regulator